MCVPPLNSTPPVPVRLDPAAWVTLFAPLVFVLIFASRLHKMSPTTAIVVFLAFSVVMGVSLAPVAIIYTGESIASVFAITAITYAALAFWGFSTKRDLAPMGKFLFMVLIGMFVSGIVMMIMMAFGVTINPVIFMIRAGIGVLLFAGLTVEQAARALGIATSTADEDWAYARSWLRLEIAGRPAVTAEEQ